MSTARDRGWEEVRAAAADSGSGAAEITRRAAEALALLPRSDLEEAAAALVRGHTSMASLWRLGSDVLAAADHAAVARGFVAALAWEAAAVARAAAPSIEGTVITQSYSSTVVHAVAVAGATALCARSEPGGEGRETARRLVAAGVRAREVPDAEALREARAGRTVVVGADAVGPRGVVNKVGTRGLAEAARTGGGRAVVLTGSSKLLRADLPAPLPFERCPLDRFDAVISQRGALTPGEAVREAARHPLHPALATVLEELRTAEGRATQTGYDDMA